VNGRTVATLVPEFRVGTAVIGGTLPVIKKLGKIHVLFDWIGQEQRMVPVRSATTMEMVLSVCTV